MENKAMESAEDRFGRNVRRLREEAGLKQADLAERVGAAGLKLHPSAIAKIELRDVASPRSVRVNEAEAIAKALDVPLDELLGGASEELRVAGEFFDKLVMTQRYRSAVGNAVEDWLDCKGELRDGLKRVSEYGVDRIDKVADGFRDETVAEAKRLLRETLTDVVDAYMESRHQEEDGPPLDEREFLAALDRVDLSR